MKNALFILLFLTAATANAQEKYTSFSTEMIFSFATIDNMGNTGGNVMRWAPVVNPQIMLNYDLSNAFGVFTGLASRNVGFIYDDPFDANNTRFKFRTYNLGIPVGFKVGQLDNFMFFGGYEIEFPYVYKEKTFVNESKVNKDVIWFSKKVEPVQHSLLAGIQFPYGGALKFKYYLTNFHNRDYVAMIDGKQTKPYDFKSNVWYISLSWYLFSNWKETIPY
jgi:hypothetical protein